MADSKLFALLKEDHAQARHLMEKILTTNENERQNPFIDLSDAVQLHMHLEEQYLYPRLEGHKVLNAAQKDAIREHDEARVLFQQLDRIDLTDKEWLNQFRLLQQGLLKHMQVEEGYVFEKCRDIFTDNQLQEIAEKCIQQKQVSKRQQPAREQEIRS